MAETKRHVTAPPAPVPGGIAARAMATRTAAAPYLADLNPEQKEAVETLDGPVLVLAGAGTGKTRVLTTRIAHILNLGRAHPREILAVTFTNKAAREMKERVGKMVGQIVEGMPWLGTFHAIGVKILRRHAEMVGLKSDFTILGVDDQIRLIKQILEAEKLDEKRWPARVFAIILDGWKNRGLTPEQVPAGEAAAFANGKGKRLYAAYQERLKTLNAADFGDLLLECIRLFREHPDVLKQYQQRFKFILVDEYQDTNVAQYLWLRLLAQTPAQQAAAQPSPLAGEGKEERKNICCVGDDDQSIYGWRGAEVDNILRFDHDFPGAKVIRLERNYRSTGHILAAASHLIAHNEGRLGKTLRTEDEDGEKVQVTGAWDSEEEARSIGEEIEQMQREARDAGLEPPLDEIAILVRASFQMREFEERFIQLGLPYRVIGGPRFYERAEIRDALAYLRVIAQPADDLAFERIVNVPKRGLGDATVQMLHDYARRQRIPLTEAAALLSSTDEMKPKPRTALRDLMASFARWRKQKEILPHAELAEIVLDESGYTEMWQKDRSADAAGRLENLKELVRASFQMREFEERFIQLGLPYRVIGGPRFYERAEIRDALAYLRVIAQPADDLAFERIVNVPKRGLGDATVQMLHDYARRQRIPLTEAAALLSSTDEMKPKPRNALRDLMASFARWRKQKEILPHAELAEIVLDESGYTEMWQKDRSADAAGRLENLKELVRAMQEFDNLQGFLEHIALVMDTEQGLSEQKVSIMTLHSAKGLEFDTVFLPGWEEGLFPHQRSLDESGRNGLEEERRLAHVGITRARKRAKIYFASNRRIHGMWSSNIPSRFLDELPEAHVEVKEASGGTGGFGMSGYGASRFDEVQSFGSNYTTPGWQRAQSRKGAGGFDVTGKPREGRGGFSEGGGPQYVPDGIYEDSDGYDAAAPSSPPPLRGRDREGGAGPKVRRPSSPLTIEGELVAKSTGASSIFAVGERVFHLKFGNGNVTAVDGNKLTIVFDKAGEKRVVDSFVERV